MTSVWDENQTPLRRVITDHITKVIGKKKRQGHSQTLEHSLKIKA